ncbi:MAG: histidine kinase, partial [Verrucomicrobiota bacterium]
LEGRELPSRAGIYWVRWRARQSDLREFRLRDGLLFKMIASYDVYWDGRLIGRNGRVSTVSEDEGPGVVDALFQIPAELLGPGEHVVALRMSSWNTGFSTPVYLLGVNWGNFRMLLVERSRTAMFSVMAVGAALVVAVVFGLMWALAGRRFALLLFSVLFLCVGLMQALQAWRWLYEYPYNWHHPRLVTITALIALMSVLLPAFLLHHFEVGRKALVYGVLVISITCAWFSTPYYNASGLAICCIGFVMALVLAARAVWVRKRGAGFACAGLAVSVFMLLTAPRDFLDHAFFISAGPAVLGLLVALVLQLRDERREAQQAVLTAARLEIELLKKNLQPHFLINTLATIQETIEQEPRTASAMVEALATEFRILNRISGEKLVALEQELELCRAHLRVMSLRKAARCALRTSGLDEQALVPPALFHTLIENGLTHLLPREGRLDFELRAEQRPGTTRYVLLAVGQRQQTEVVGVEPVEDGTGTRYVKARLEESFTGRWQLTAGPVLEGWETVIDLAPAGAGSGIDAHKGAAASALPRGKLA